MNGIESWICGFRESPSMSVETIDLEHCEPWSFVNGALERPDGRFFRVTGVDIGSRHQLFIDQPEVGVLGFAFTDDGPNRRVLVQAKDEPGNEHLTQIAPTIQATKSNFESSHGGAEVPYLDFFTASTGSRRVLNDSRLSEHGERFWKKQNRNLTVDAQQLLPLAGPRYRWVLLTELLESMDIDFLVNTDARSVLAATPWAELCDSGGTPFGGGSDFERLLSASFNQNKDATDTTGSAMDQLQKARSETQKRPLPVFTSLERFVDVTEKEWVRCIRVSSESREVGEWSQPIYETTGLDRNTLLMARRRGELVVVLRLSEELGLRTAVEWSTTTSNTTTSSVVERFLAAGEIKATLRQTEEGSRFFHSHAQFDLVDCELEVDDKVLVSEGLRAVNLSTFNRILSTSHVTTNELRSAASLILRWI